MPGPLNQFKHRQQVGDGTLILQPSPRPTVHGDVGAHAHVPVLVFDDEPVLTFLRSVARARALRNHTKMVWANDSSRALNFLYAAMLVKGRPGHAEVDTGNQRQIDADTEKFEAELLESFFNHVERGPAAVAKFLEGEQQIRDYALGAVHDTYADAGKLNNAIMGEVRSSIAILATIKCAATIAVKTMAFAAGGRPAAFAVSTGYSLVLEQIQDWGKAGSGKAIAMQLGRAAGTRAIKQGAAGMAGIHAAEAIAPAHKAAWLAKRVEAMERQLAAGGTGRELRKLARDSRRLQAAENEASNARAGALVFGSVRWIFLAVDIGNAVNTWRQDMHDAGYAL